MDPAPLLTSEEWSCLPQRHTSKIISLLFTLLESSRLWEFWNVLNEVYFFSAIHVMVATFSKRILSDVRPVWSGCSFTLKDSCIRNLVLQCGDTK